MSILDRIRPLTSEERKDCWERARRIVAGEAPEQSSFVGSSIREYPAWVPKLVLGLCGLMLIASFIPSAIRVYAIGSIVFSKTISDQTSSSIAGLAMILSCETGQIIFTLARSVLDSHLTKRDKYLFTLGAVLATAMALIGNIEQSDPSSQHLIFAWLESVTPPIFTLATSTILKSYLLSSLKERYADTKNYQQAKQSWEIINRNPEISPDWQSHYANTLRDKIFQVNNRSKIGKEVLPTLQLQDWVNLVRRELQIESWYAGAMAAEEARTIEEEKNEQAAIPAVTQTETTSEIEAETFTAKCEVCGTTLGTNYKTKRAAINALSGHSKRHQQEP